MMEVSSYRWASALIYGKMRLGVNVYVVII